MIDKAGDAIRQLLKTSEPEDKKKPPTDYFGIVPMDDERRMKQILAPKK